MRHYRNQIRFFAGAAILLQAMQPLSAASIQTSSVKLESKNSNVERTLKNLKINVEGTKIGITSKTKGGVSPFDRVLLAQTQTGQTPGVLVPNPEVTIDGNPVSFPPNENIAPPFLPRAVAPPVGDMSVSNTNTAADTINLGTRAVVQNLVLKDAPVREVLGFLARAAGLNLIFSGGGPLKEGEQAPPEPTISLDLEREALQDVFNSVLLISGLNANRRGNTIYVGARLPDAARNLISRSIRVNQVPAIDAATFLASQGATYDRIVSEIVDNKNNDGNVTETRRTTPEFKPLNIIRDSLSTAPLLLNGLKVSADERLNIVSLVGEPSKVEIATAFLTQLDARRRQVAINVKIIDVNLLNEDTYSSSFSFGINDSFFVQDQGAASLRFGNSSPATRNDLNTPTGRATNPPAIDNPFASGNTFLDFNNPIQIPGTIPDIVTISPNGQITRQSSPPGQFPSGSAGVSGNPFQTGITNYTVAQDTVITFNPQTGVPTVTLGSRGTATQALADFFQFPKKFLSLLEAQIINRNAKILTDPTLVVQEGEKATVKLVENAVTDYEIVQGNVNTNPIAKPVSTEVGLTLNINIEKIDDNGFVNLIVNPIVSSPGDLFEIGLFPGQTNLINLINKRELNTGLIRLRDNQTLILSGIIQESDRTTVSKIPVLGDLPLIGALFRSTSRSKERAEVIILLTPQIIEDSEQSSFGYKYVPGQDARRMLRERGLPVQGNP